LKYDYSDVPYGEAFEDELHDDKSTTSVLMTFEELNKYFEENIGFETAFGRFTLD
jgi:hypothetical protein